MEKYQKICIKKVSSLLAENKLKEAFNLLDEYLSAIGVSTDLEPYFIAASSQFHRTEKEYRLGTISWEQYNISNSQIVVKTLDLTTNVCSYIYEVTALNTKNKVLDAFKGKGNSIGSIMDEIDIYIKMAKGALLGKRSNKPKINKIEVEKSFKKLAQEIAKLKMIKP